MVPPYTYADIARAYALPRNVTWTNPYVVAIVDAYDHLRIESDLAILDRSEGIPDLPHCTVQIANSRTPCFEKVNQNGMQSDYPSFQQSWALEIALDVETVHALCLKCSVLLVEATDDSGANLMTAIRTAIQLKANAISNSWGGAEYPDEVADDAMLNAPGIPITISAGDDGFVNGNSPEYPAASQFGTAVGGTSLYLNPDGSYALEVAWSGTGSGCSGYLSAPAWQSGAEYAIGCGKRVGNDIAAVADPNTGVWIYDSLGYSGQPGGWFAMGGTSLSAPIIAAIYALANDVPSGTLANSVPAARHDRNVFHDVAFGTNGSCGSHLCNSRTGFDGPTGWGSPAGIGGF